MASDDAVTKIIDSLKETDELPRRQISEIVEVLGSEVALGLLEEVRRVQTEGGIAVRDGTRRRTDGGVFFSLAKGKLPKSDRNRIFRVRVAKPAEEGAEGGAAPAAAEPPRPPQAEERRPRQLEMPMTQKAPSTSTSVATVAGGGTGRRRVVEVEVLRHHAKPVQPAPAADNGVRQPPRAAEPAPPPPPRELRPVRRIVVAAPVVKEEPPATPEAAREKVRAALTAISVPDQRRLLLDLLKQIGGVPELEPKREPKRAPEPPKPPPPPPQKQGLDDAGRERVLAAVTEALGLSTSDLARVLYGEETAGTRARARSVLERYRKSR